jgi:hypothetical protein
VPALQLLPIVPVHPLPAIQIDPPNLRRRHVWNTFNPAKPTSLDASLLVMPIVKCSGPTDPRFLKTLDRMNEQLVSDSLVHRYAFTGHDGLRGSMQQHSWGLTCMPPCGSRRAARQSESGC